MTTTTAARDDAARAGASAVLRGDGARVPSITGPRATGEGMSTESYALVTTAHKGVFCGRIVDTSDDGRTIHLADARNVIYWSGKRGVLGLTTTGPDPDSRLGDTAPRITLYDVTMVAQCTAEAEAALRGWAVGR